MSPLGNNMSRDIDINENIQLPLADLPNKDRPTEMEMSSTPSDDGAAVTADASHTPPQSESMIVIAPTRSTDPSRRSIVGPVP